MNNKDLLTIRKEEIPSPVEKKRKCWFKCLKTVLRIVYKKPAFVFLGEEFQNGSMILSNHDGSFAPMTFEIHSKHPTRMWGTHEMNSGLKKMYKYQTEVYYHQKKHWNIHAAKAFCLLASPLTNMFYKGLNLISTYQDGRLIKTIKDSVASIKKGESIIIYPENSDKGYFEVLTGFYAGFNILAETCYRRGYDIPIYVSYFRRKDRVYIIDKPILYSEVSKGRTREEIAEFLLKRCNELGQMQFTKEFLKETKKNNKQSDKKLRAELKQLKKQK